MVRSAKTDEAERPDVTVADHRAHPLSTLDADPGNDTDATAQWTNSSSVVNVTVVKPGIALTWLLAACDRWFAALGGVSKQPAAAMSRA